MDSQTRDAIEAQRKAFEAMKRMPVRYSVPVKAETRSFIDVMMDLKGIVPIELRANCIYTALMTKQFCIDTLTKAYDILRRSNVKDAVVFKRHFDRHLKDWDICIKRDLKQSDREELEMMRISWMDHYGFEEKIKHLYVAYDNIMMNERKMDVNLASLVAWMCTLWTIIEQLNAHENRNTQKLKEYNQNVIRNHDDFAYDLTNNLTRLIKELGGIEDVRKVSNRMVNMAANVLGRALDNDPFHTIIYDVKAIRKRGCDGADTGYVCALCDKFPCKERKALRNKTGA